MDQEGVTLYVGNEDGYLFELRTATIADVMRAIELAKSAERVFTYAPEPSEVAVIQLLDFCNEECKVYIVLGDECAGKVTRLPIVDAIGLVKSICAGVTPDRTGWDELT